MPQASNIRNSKYSPQIRGYDTNTAGNFSNKFKGNVAEYIACQYDYEIYAYSDFTEGTLSVFNNGGKFERDSGSWISDGFTVGASVRWMAGFVTQDHRDVTFTCTGLSEDGKIMFTDYSGEAFDSFQINNEVAQPLFINITALTNCDYGYGLVDNKESFSIQSKLTGEDQQFYFEGINSGGTVDGQIAGEIRGWAAQQGYVTLIALAKTKLPVFRELNFGDLLGVVPNEVQNFRLKHVFPILPFYLAGELDSLEQNISELLEGQKSFKHVFQLQMKPNATDENGNRTIKLQNLEGSTGFFNENFNGKNSQYSVNNVNYFDNVSGDPVDSVLVSGITRVEATLTSEDGTFTNGQPFVAFHSYLPDDEQEYVGSTDTFETNFAFDSVRAGQTGNIISSVSSTFVNANTKNVTFLIDLAGVKPELTQESNYIVGVVLENDVLDSNNSDRVSLRLDINNYTKNPDIPDLFFVDKMEAYSHIIDINQTGKTDYKGWIQDGYAVQGTFKLDRTKFAYLDSLSINIVAWKDGTNEFFTIQENTFDIQGNQTIVNGNQQINIEQTQGFKLALLDQFNEKKITTSTFDGQFQNYEFLLGLKINWQDWVSLPNADTIFYDVSEPNNGLNKNSSRYSLKEGYTLFTIIKADVLETQQNASTQYIHKQRLIANDFGVIGDEDWELVDNEIKTFDSNSENLSGQVLTGQDTIIRAEYQPNFAVTPDLNEYEAVIRIVEELPTGEKTIYELSTFRSAPVDNLLIPLEGETTLKKFLNGNNIVLECRTDKNLIKNVGYQLSSRLFSGTSAFIAGEFSDDFNEDFFI